MANIKRRSIEMSEVSCSNIDDLSTVVRILEDLPDEAEFELTISIELPGIGRKVIRLLDEVPIQVSWKTTNSQED